MGSVASCQKDNGVAKSCCRDHQHVYRCDDDAAVTPDAQMATENDHESSTSQSEGNVPTSSTANAHAVLPPISCLPPVFKQTAAVHHRPMSSPGCSALPPSPAAQDVSLTSPPRAALPAPLSTGLPFFYHRDVLEREREGKLPTPTAAANSFLRSMARSSNALGSPGADSVLSGIHTLSGVCYPPPALLFQSGTASHTHSGVWRSFAMAKFPEKHDDDDDAPLRRNISPSRESGDLRWSPGGQPALSLGQEEVADFTSLIGVYEHRQGMSSSMFASEPHATAAFRRDGHVRHERSFCVLGASMVVAPQETSPEDNDMPSLVSENNNSNSTDEEEKKGESSCAGIPYLRCPPTRIALALFQEKTQ